MNGMNLQKLYDMKSKFVVRAVGNELILVPLTANVAQMNELFTLNETARFIWENIGERTTVDDLEKSMTEAFNIDAETAKKDIENFIKKLQTIL
jgi:hypothetical protein